MLAVTGEDPQYASPGVLGFMVVFLLAVATYLLIRSMVGHLRRVRYSAEAEAEREAERARAAEAATSSAGVAAERATPRRPDGGPGGPGGPGSG